MTVVGLCSQCGKPAMLACPLCGLIFCSACLDFEKRLCRSCRQRMREQAGDDGTMG